MKIWRFSVNVKKLPKPLSELVVTQLSSLVEDRLIPVEQEMMRQHDALEEMRKNVEAIRRKVYRDAAGGAAADEPVGQIPASLQGNGQGKGGSPAAFRPGDSIYF